MSADMEVESKLNQIVNAVTEQDRARLKALIRYPIVILYGEFPEILKQMIDTELGNQVGYKNAVEIVSVISNEKLNETMEKTVNLFRKRMDEGALKSSTQYYIPVIFMADQLRVGSMEEMLQKIFREMKRLGMEYEVWYYCVFNYGWMNGTECGKQILKLQEDVNYNFPISIVTHNNASAEEYHQYLKAIRSIAMHIFLKISEKDLLEALIENGERKKMLCVMGYWKTDVLRQQIAGYLIRCIENQDKDMVGTSDYSSQIQNIIEKIIPFNETEWINYMCRLPVNYSKAKCLLQTRRRLFGKLSENYANIFETFYGRSDVFTKFVEKNIGNGSEEENIYKFFCEKIGNIFLVTNRLKETLQKIKRRYESEKTLLHLTNNYDDKCYFKRDDALTEILSRLRSNFWEEEAGLIELDRKILFVDNLLSHIELCSFKEMIKRVKDRNQNEKNHLALIQREDFGDGKRILSLPALEIGEGQLLNWNEDIFEESFLEQTMDIMPQIKNQVQEWFRCNMEEVLGSFIEDLHKIKMQQLNEKYYTAKMNISKPVREKEYLYIGTARQGMEELQNIVSRSINTMQVKEREWETEMCFELFSIREISSIEDIYGIK